MASSVAFDLRVELVAELLVAELESRLDQRGIVLDADVGVGVDIAQDPAFALGHGVLAELLGRHFVAPLAERAFGELLDVALVHQRHGLASRLERMLDGIAHQPLGAEDRNRLDAHAGVARGSSSCRPSAGRR